MKTKHLSLAAIILLLILSATSITAQEIQIDVPYYVQGKDSTWADEKLGSKSSVTIRTHGCALTCISMVISHFTKKDYNPSKMNKWLNKNNGYRDGWDGDVYMGKVSLNWPALAGFDKGMVYSRFDWNTHPADIELIKYYLGQGIPVIAEVSYRSAPHYIVLTGWNDEKGFIMKDPEFPDISLFNSEYAISDKWGSGPSRNIYGIRVLYPAPDGG